MTERDYIGAARAILRVQRVYNLSCSDLANGDVYGRKAAPLTIADIEYIGMRALDLAEYDLMVYWFELALSLAPPNDHVTKSRLLHYLAQAHYHVGWALYFWVGFDSTSMLLNFSRQCLLRAALSLCPSIFMSVCRSVCMWQLFTMSLSSDLHETYTRHSPYKIRTVSTVSGQKVKVKGNTVRSNYCRFRSMAPC